MILQSGDFEKSIDVLGHFYKWFFSLILQKTVVISSSLCPIVHSAGRLHRNPHRIQSWECASSAPFSSMEPSNCETGRPVHSSRWSSSCGLFCGDNSGRMIAGLEPHQLLAQWIGAWNIFDHLFASCSYSKQVWFRILGHANLQIPSAAAQIIDWWYQLHLGGEWRQTAQAGTRFLAGDNSFLSNTKIRSSLAYSQKTKWWSFIRQEKIHDCGFKGALLLATPVIWRVLKVSRTIFIIALVELWRSE